MNKKFWNRVGVKLIENLLSVKVWVLVAFLVVSTKLLMMGLLTGDIWATANGATIAVVFALRESFKVAKVKSDDDTEDMMV